jgi:pyrroloquinoline quinone biosynthesis protein B
MFPSKYLAVVLLLVCVSRVEAFGQKRQNLPQQFLVVLGIAQDAGYPQIGCEQEHCLLAQRNPSLRRSVVSLGVVDQGAKQKWLVEATPDITSQLFVLNKYSPSPSMLPDGVFVTHAHIGHYTGLMYFGREAIGARSVPVYVMPRMESFLTNNGPWSQLVSLKNISLRLIKADEILNLKTSSQSLVQSTNFKKIEFRNLTEGQTLALNTTLSIKPFLVPHRDEFSETVGFEIIGQRKRAIFIPDIDKWTKWDVDLRQLIRRVDYALVDGTFYKNGELPNRDMAEIPHPFVEESVKLLQDLPAKEKAKVIFIHFNHTNPLIRKNSAERRELLRKGFRIADEGLVLGL